MNFGITAGTTAVTVEKVIDSDDPIGYYYKLSYTSTDGKSVVISIRIEDKDYYPDDANLDFSLDGITDSTPSTTYTVQGDSGMGESSSSSSPVSIKDNQISFNGSFPVGLHGMPVVYTITVEVTDSDGTTTTVSDSIEYWDDHNICPGYTETPGSQSGIDLSQFATGAVLGDTTYYVLFSDLTKVVNGYTFSSGESKNYVFTIYRRAANSDDAWTAFDTITITANSTTTTTDFTTDATKYDVENITDYEYKIVETGYTISGYGCTNVIEVKNENDEYVTSASGVFAFSESTNDDENTVIYSAGIKCTNTYTEAGLTVSKVTENAPSGAASDEFTVKVWPKQLSTDGIETGTNMYTYFNGGTYKVGGSTLTVTGGSDDTYGYLTVTLTGGTSKTITGLPAGTYYVQEVKGSNTNWTYDVTMREADLSSGSASVTITNTYKYANLTITKTGLDMEKDPNQSTIYTVTGPSGFTLDVIINGNESVTIKDLLIGTYTVTEKDDWSWRYTAAPASQSITLTADGDNSVTFSNTRSEPCWLSGDNYNENQFTVNTANAQD